MTYQITDRRGEHIAYAECRSYVAALRVLWATYGPRGWWRYYVREVRGDVRNLQSRDRV